jgi:hypothetical protein
VHRVTADDRGSSFVKANAEQVRVQTYGSAQVSHSLADHDVLVHCSIRQIPECLLIFRRR